MTVVRWIFSVLSICLVSTVTAEECPLVTDDVVQDMLDDADWVIAGEITRLETTEDPIWKIAHLDIQDIIKQTSLDINRSDFPVKFQKQMSLKRGHSYLLYVFETPEERIVGPCNSVPIGRRPRPDSDFLKHMFALAKIKAVSVSDQVREASTMAKAAKNGVVAYFNQKGFLPSDNADLGWEASPHAYSGKYVSSIQVNYGTVVVQFGRSADKEIFGKYLSYTPYEKTEDDTTEIVWRCGNAEPPADLPLAGSAVGIPTAAVETTVKTIYLPPDCSKESAESVDIKKAESKPGLSGS